MSSLEILALAIVVLAGVYLLGLGAASLFAPTRASRFLLGFAGSRSVHFTEQFLRGMVGAALVLHAPRMQPAAVFELFGWALVVTSSCLAIVPWHWHHRFAQKAVPLFTRHIALIGLVSLLLGAFILGATVRGNAG